MAADVRLVADAGHPDFLDLPWETSLVDWQSERLVEMAQGLSRHIVRFVRYDDRVYALKETTRPDANREFEVLRELRREHLPVVEPVGVVSTGGTGDAYLITRYLDFSLPYWYLLGRDEPSLIDRLIDRLLDAGVVLLVRLHLEKVFWGDCSLSNILFRRDAGSMMAYLVDAETTESRGSLTDAMRDYDLRIAEENFAGGLLDLQAAERIPSEIDPFATATEIRIRYERLWDELTRTDEFAVDERWRIDERIRHINSLGFDVEELSISADESELRIKPVLVEEGHHSRELRRQTGLDVQENQARRLLADIESYRAWLEHDTGTPLPSAVAAARWLADVYEPLIRSVPDDLRRRLEPPEIFHQLLDHRHYLSQQRGEEVSNEDALADYMYGVLPERPSERQLEPGNTAGGPAGLADAEPGWRPGV